MPPFQSRKAERGSPKIRGTTIVLVFFLSVACIYWTILHIHTRTIAGVEESWERRHLDSPVGAQLGSTGSADTRGAHSNATGILGHCHIDEHNEYHGDVVVWGNWNKKDTAAECCTSCFAAPTCDIWVWCGQPDGCGGGPTSFKECWLKKVGLEDIIPNFGQGHAGIRWTAGSVYTQVREGMACAAGN